MMLQQESIRFTYADYLSWDEQERIELIDGEPVMHATPSTIHQVACRNLLVSFHRFLEERPCRIYPAPLSVRLNAQYDNSDTTVLEPDLFVVCDLNKMTDQGCEGPPDLVIEVLSPSTARLDRVVKFRKYLQGEVREYWIVDPEARTIQTHILSGNQYVAAVYEEGERAPVYVLPGMHMPVSDVFQE